MLIRKANVLGKPVITDEMLEGSKRIPRELGLASAGDRIVVIAGVPIGIRGTTNFIKVEVVE
jgi:pyruvate kinase